MDDYTPTEKAEFVLGWARGLSSEDKAVFATAAGIPIAEATSAEVAEAEGKPAVIDGKTEQPGYKYLEALNISVIE